MFPFLMPVMESVAELYFLFLGRLQVGEVVTTIPTIGFNVEQVTYKNLKFQVWDLGGQTSIRYAVITCNSIYIKVMY